MDAGPLPPGFFVSVADKGLRVSVSRLESTLVSDSITVDSKRLTGSIETHFSSGTSVLNPSLVVPGKPLKSKNASWKLALHVILPRIKNTPFSGFVKTKGDEP